MRREQKKILFLHFNKLLLMNTKSVYFLAVVFIAVLMSSCAANKLMYTSIDVLRPAEVTFAGDVSRLLLVNNTVSQPANYKHSTVRLLDGVKIPVSVNTDSLSLFMLSALSEELLNKEFFYTNDIVLNSINKSSDFEEITPLLNHKLQSLAKECNADVVLSLNHLETIDELNEGYNTLSEEAVLSLDVVYDTWWTIQYPDEEKKSQIIHYQDTVYWELSHYSRKKLFENFPDRYDALIDGALYVGQKMINRLVPYWEEVDRYLFEINNPQMLRGMEEVYQKNWADAIPYWETALNNATKKKQKALIQNNLAVAYEINGELDKALSLITQAIDNYNSTFAEKKSLDTMLDHKDSLLTRLKQQILIKEQIAE